MMDTTLNPLFKGIKSFGGDVYSKETKAAQQTAVNDIPNSAIDAGTRYGTKAWGQSAVNNVNNAYLSGGEDAADSVAATENASLIGRGLKLSGGQAGAGVIGGVIGGAEGYAKGGTQGQKETNVGNGIVVGAVTGLATFAAVTALTGGTDLPIIVVVGIGFAVSQVVGPVIEVANDWLYKNVPAVKDFENSVGSLGTGIGDLITGKWGNLGKDFSDAAKDYLNVYKDVNGWITKTVPIVGQGERFVGETLKRGAQYATSVISAGQKFINKVTDIAAHDVGNFVGSTVNSAEKVAGGVLNFAIDILGGGSGAMVGKVMSIKDPIERAAAELLLLHQNLDNIQHVN